MSNYDQPPIIIRTKGSRKEEEKQAQEQATPSRPSQGIQPKKQQDPVTLLQQQMLGVKNQFNQVKSQLGELKILRRVQEEQAKALEALENVQKSLVEALNQISLAMEEFLAKERPEASEAALTVGQRVMDLEDQVGKIWEAVEKLEKRTGLSS